MPLSQRLCGAFCFLIWPAIFLGFYANQFSIDKGMQASNQTQCCAVQTEGTWSGVPCDQVPDGTSSTNVSLEFYNVCLWAIIIYSIQIAGILCFVITPLMPCGMCLQYLASLGGFAWVITLTVFVFREEGLACNFVDPIPGSEIEKAWADEWKFQERVAIAIWGIAAGMCGLSCLMGICSCICGGTAALMQK